MKPYQQIPIIECGEPLLPIPLEKFAVVSPHPYQHLGATYSRRSPYYLRESVVKALIMAQSALQIKHPHWQIQIFDAYRPVEVQQFMVDYTFAQLVKKQGYEGRDLTATQSQKIWEEVYKFWAVPNYNPATPPPHSTGAAIDITLVDEHGETVNMGTDIDEISPASYPNYFAESLDPVEKKYDRHREILWEVMASAGFMRHPHEWWHFSLGDQMWAWLYNQKNPSCTLSARYGKV